MPITLKKNDLWVYKHLQGKGNLANPNANKYKMKFVVKLPSKFTAVLEDDMTGIPTYDVKNPTRPTEKKCRECNIIIKPGTSNGTVFLETEFFKEADRVNVSHVWVRVKGKGVIIIDPDTGGVGSYDDPDSET